MKARNDVGAVGGQRPDDGIHHLATTSPSPVTSQVTTNPIRVGAELRRVQTTGLATRSPKRLHCSTVVAGMCRLTGGHQHDSHRAFYHR